MFETSGTRVFRPQADSRPRELWTSLDTSEIRATLGTLCWSSFLREPSSGVKPTTTRC